MRVYTTKEPIHAEASRLAREEMARSGCKKARMRVYMAALQRLRREHGLCVRCQKPAAPKTECVECMRKRATAAKIHKHSRCKYCGGQPGPSRKTVCDSCVAPPMRETARTRYARRKAEGGCVNCANTNEPGSIYCTKCHARHNRWNMLYQRRLATLTSPSAPDRSGEKESHS